MRRTIFFVCALAAALALSVNAKAWEDHVIQASEEIRMDEYTASNWGALARLNAVLRSEDSSLKKKLTDAGTLEATQVSAQASAEGSAFKRKQKPFILVEAYTLLPSEIPASLASQMQTTIPINGQEVAVQIPMVARAPASGYVRINSDTFPLTANPAMGRGLVARIDASNLVNRQNDIEVVVLDANGGQLFKDVVPIYVWN